MTGSVGVETQIFWPDAVLFIQQHFLFILNLFSEGILEGTFSFGAFIPVIMSES